ncbi:coproporphyrinogen III oxidase [Candidatus Tenderia electrophaga]|jgi:oxygen-independent coproporphyrinogen-3 oxidase|uniref:Heme chaperone HemW n=1 Tax=Candidatus Tenderia electrophaga TaxID=1748243 RepID=A0A0S2T916_9GAMM|nr:coproporphyrinogen III oxidase [Candidatus Tenderia electrophaga]
MFNFTTLPPLSLYLHIPWCVRKCPYCDFNSHEAKRDIPEHAYVAALISDLEQELPDVWGRQVHSIFIGGGTPSLFSAEALDQLFSALRARLNLAANAEITLEANPGAIEADKFREFRALGINRLSIGVQSFNDDALQRIGRIHGRREATRAAERAHDAGFDNFNLDLMFGLPQQTLEQAREDVATAIALEPSHISHYQLTLEPNTLFHHKPPPLPEDELLWRMQEHCQAQLGDAGYQHYEVSAFAKDQRRCRHNLNYWQFGDYLGIGAGAHGKISNAQLQTIQRRSKLRRPEDYLAQAHSPARISTEQTLSERDAGFEFMLNALRLTDGFAPHLFSDHTGLPISVVEQPLRQAEEQGLIDWSVRLIRPTEKGRNYLNELLQLFLP